MTTSLFNKFFIFALWEGPFLIGNQDGVEQDKETERIKRRMKIGKRNIGLLKSFLLLNNINKYTLKWAEKQPLDVPV
jgi:hypothetical protein